MLNQQGTGPLIPSLAPKHDLSAELASAYFCLKISQKNKLAVTFLPQSVCRHSTTEPLLTSLLPRQRKDNFFIFLSQDNPI